MLLRPLPYPEPDRLVSSFDAFPGAGVERAGTSVPNYVDRRAMTDVLSAAALYQWWGYRVGEGAQAEGVSAMNVTPSFFQVLGARPARGRLFAEADGTPGRNKVALLCYTFAARQSGGIDGVVGSRLRLNDDVHADDNRAAGPHVRQHRAGPCRRNNARVWGGMHYPSTVKISDALGEAITEYVNRNAMQRLESGVR